MVDVVVLLAWGRAVAVALCFDVYERETKAVSKPPAKPRSPRAFLVRARGGNAIVGIPGNPMIGCDRYSTRTASLGKGKVFAKEFWKGERWERKAEE